MSSECCCEFSDPRTEAVGNTFPERGGGAFDEVEVEVDVEVEVEVGGGFGVEEWRESAMGGRRGRGGRVIGLEEEGLEEEEGLGKEDEVVVVEEVDKEEVDEVEEDLEVSSEVLRMLPREEEKGEKRGA